MIVDPWGVVLAPAPDRETVIVADLDLAAQDDIRRRAARAGQPPPDGLRAPAGGHRLMAARNAQAAADKRRLILDAAVRVFARQGFHTCRVSDIADEAGVAYGLVYHYFRSKDEVLDTLFLERWNVLLEVDPRGRRPRDARRATSCYAIASFIVDSYRHDPDLMKVIIVEVTRAANSFGRTPPGEDPRGLRADRGRSSAKAQADGRVQGHASRRRSPRWPSTARSSRSSPAGSSTCCRAATDEFEQAKAFVVETICGGLESEAARSSGRSAIRRETAR